MAGPNRRDLVLGAGVVAGLAAVGTAPVFGADEEKMDPKDVLQKIKLTGEAEKKLAEMVRAAIPVALMPGGQPARKDDLDIEGKAVAKKTPDGRVFATGLTFTCDPRVINRFTVGGNPLTAKRFSFSMSEISWAAGDGWPVYASYCPQDAYHTGMYYRDAKVHQIVPSIKGQNYFVGCASSAVCESPGVGQISFAVNDGGADYGDNRGYFVVTIWSWS